MPYTVTIRHADTHEVLDVVTCPDLRSALRAKSNAVRSYHHGDLGGQVVVPATMDFDDWGDVERLRYGNRGPFLPVHAAIDQTLERTCAPGLGGEGLALTPIRSQARAGDVSDRYPR